LKTKELTLMNGAQHVPIYARVSTNDKDQNPETQLRPLRAHVEDLPNITMVSEFVDSAGADDLRGRLAWRQLLALTRKRQVHLIVVWKLDRAFRSVVDGATTLQALRQCGCVIRSLQEPWIDTTTPVGEALYHITLAWAQLEKRQLAERVKAGMERGRAEGRHVGRPRRRRSVTEHPRWRTVLRALEAVHVTRAEAANKLHVRKATLLAELQTLEAIAPHPGSAQPMRIISTGLPAPTRAEEQFA
jgi:DNA invertase Pin-like site-specific DNA recombinase